MHDVAIIGAGELGGALANMLARRGVVSSIQLVDETGGVAAGKALDIMQSAPIEGFATTVRGGTDIASSAGASIVVVADRATGGEWTGEEGLLVLKRLARGRVTLCAGADARELVERGARELTIPRAKLFGSAPEALAAAIRAMVAIEANGSPQDVALTVLGIPPSHMVVPWEEVTIAGLMATRVLDAPALRRLSARVAPLWPPGPHALASAAAKAIDIMVGQSRRMMTCFVAPDDSAGRRMRAAALPARLGPAGIAAAEVPELNVHDRVALESAIML